MDKIRKGKKRRQCGVNLFYSYIFFYFGKGWGGGEKKKKKEERKEIRREWGHPLPSIPLPLFPFPLLSFRFLYFSLFSFPPFPVLAFLEGGGVKAEGKPPFLAMGSLRSFEILQFGRCGREVNGKEWGANEVGYTGADGTP